ncbi:MAG: aldehyde dehydrogenase family protein [Psychrilyobacter sp.]|nr:aldehyde dehydrogenase family protein [Psychrilyobacter sp.]
MEAKLYIDGLMEKARVAQKELAGYSQEELDAIVKILAKTVYDNAEDLAEMAIKETRMGVYEDKVAKNRGKSKTIWHNIKDKKTVGIIGRDLEKNLIKVAKPIGVIGAVTPTTNPIVTPMCNAMFAVKGGNSIIVAPHPRSKKCSFETIARVEIAIAKAGIRYPKNAIQVISETSIEATNLLMSSVDVVLATGGMAMVRAAYSSGKPSYGVGAGNVQVILDRDIDYNDATLKIINGRKFDNGIICSGEQTVIAPADKYDEVIKALQNNGAFYVEDEETVEKFRTTIFVDGHMNKDVVGQSVQTIAKMAGVAVPEEAKVILLKSKGAGAIDDLSKEKMCPVLSAYTYETFDEALEIAQTNLDLEGKGHTAAIHSNNMKHIELAGQHLTISRLVVNAPSSTTAGGSFFNGFAPTTTLGCGTWGNNIISENLDYKHLINISNIGLVREDVIAPTDEEIWK